MTIEFKPKVDNTASIAKDGVDVINISATNVVTFPTTPTPSEQRIGVGQTWQDVSGSRTSGVPAINTSGRPIQVSVCTNAGASTTLLVVVGGVTLCNLSTSGQRAAHSFIVPNGISYTVTSGGGATIQQWAELR